MNLKTDTNNISILGRCQTIHFIFISNEIQIIIPLPIIYNQKHIIKNNISSNKITHIKLQYIKKLKYKKIRILNHPTLKKIISWHIHTYKIMPTNPLPYIRTLLIYQFNTINTLITISLLQRNNYTS